MKIKQVNQILKDTNMQNKECNFKITHSKGTSKLDLILERLARLDARIDHLENRFDDLQLKINHLVKVNNLKE